MKKFGKKNDEKASMDEEVGEDAPIMEANQLNDSRKEPVDEDKKIE